MFVEEDKPALPLETIVRNPATSRPLAQILALLALAALLTGCIYHDGYPGYYVGYGYYGGHHDHGGHWHRGKGHRGHGYGYGHHRGWR